MLIGVAISNHSGMNGIPPCGLPKPIKIAATFDRYAPGKARRNSGLHVPYHERGMARMHNHASVPSRPNPIPRAMRTRSCRLRVGGSSRMFQNTREVSSRNDNMATTPISATSQRVRFGTKKK